jgi:DNA-directed RNA polymerase subunit RPC12/RpoP
MPVYARDGTRCPKCRHDRYGGPYDGGRDPELQCVKCGHKFTYAEARYAADNEWRATELKRSNHKPKKAQRHAEAASLIFKRVIRAKTEAK